MVLARLLGDGPHRTAADAGAAVGTVVIQPGVRPGSGGKGEVSQDADKPPAGSPFCDEALVQAEGPQAADIGGVALGPPAGKGGLGRKPAVGAPVFHGGKPGVQPGTQGLPAGSLEQGDQVTGPAKEKGLPLHPAVEPGRGGGIRCLPVALDDRLGKGEEKGQHQGRPGQPLLRGEEPGADGLRRFQRSIEGVVGSGDPQQRRVEQGEPCKVRRKGFLCAHLVFPGTGEEGVGLLEQALSGEQHGHHLLGRLKRNGTLLLEGAVPEEGVDPIPVLQQGLGLADAL